MGALGTVSGSDASEPIEDRRKKKRFGYLAWLCLGSHYLYLGRPFTQLLFWLTLGGLLLWWLADFFRLPAMIRQRNEIEREKLIARYEESLRQRLDHLEALRRSAWTPAPTIAAIEPELAWDQTEPPTDRISGFEEVAPPPGRRSIGPALVLASALSVAATLYIFYPPPLYPHSDASFRAVRQVNVRDLPSTASPIRGVVPKETVLSGSVEEASGGTARWLKIGRGSHVGGYVAVQNLETL
jgi:hypothetical protein